MTEIFLIYEALSGAQPMSGRLIIGTMIAGRFGQGWTGARPLMHPMPENALGVRCIEEQMLSGFFGEAFEV